MIAFTAILAGSVPDSGRAHRRHQPTTSEPVMPLRLWPPLPKHQVRGLLCDHWRVAGEGLALVDAGISA